MAKKEYDKGPCEESPTPPAKRIRRDETPVVDDPLPTPTSCLGRTRLTDSDRELLIGVDKKLDMVLNILARMQSSHKVSVAANTPITTIKEEDDGKFTAALRGGLGRTLT